MHLVHILIVIMQCVLISVSYAQQEVIGNAVETQAIVLDSDASLLNLRNRTFSAVNVTIRPWEKRGTYVFSFSPISHWTDLAEVCSTKGPLPSGFIRGDCPYNSSCANFSTIDRKSIPMDVPDYWLDRSVIVLTHIVVNLPSRPCLRVIVCGMPRCEPTQPVASDCYESFGLVSTHCKARDNGGPPYTTVLSVSQRLKVSVGTTSMSLTSHPNASFSFVASIGYRLMPGVFHCPLGMFLCTPLDRCSGLNSVFCYEHRICLPNSLRCDHHVNCPGTSLDAENCKKSESGTSTNISVPYTPAKDAVDHRQQNNIEISRMRKLLSSLSNIQLEWAGYHTSEERSLLLTDSSVYLTSLSILGVSVVVFFCSWFFIRRRHRKSHLLRYRRDRTATHLQPIWPETVADEEAISFLSTNQPGASTPVESAFMPRPKWLPSASSDIAPEPEATDGSH